MFILLFSLTHVCAFENEYFKLDVPESMTEEINELGLYKWSNDNDYISITVVKNNIENKYNIENFDDEDLTNYKKYLRCIMANKRVYRLRYLSKRIFFYY